MKSTLSRARNLMTLHFCVLSILTLSNSYSKPAQAGAKVTPHVLTVSTDLAALAQKDGVEHTYFACQPFEIDAGESKLVTTSLNELLVRLHRLSVLQDMFGKGLKFSVDGIEGSRKISYEWPTKMSLANFIASIGQSSNDLHFSITAKGIVACDTQSFSDRETLVRVQYLRRDLLSNGGSLAGETAMVLLSNVLMKALESHEQRQSLNWDSQGLFKAEELGFQYVLAKSMDEEILVIEKSSEDSSKVRIYLIPLKQAKAIVQGRFLRRFTFLHFVDKEEWIADGLMGDPKPSESAEK